MNTVTLKIFSFAINLRAVYFNASGYYVILRRFNYKKNTFNNLL